MDYLDRTKKFTNKEFKNLPLDCNGDIIDLSTAFIWLTESQKSLLSDDDSSRLFDYQEELDCLMSEFC